MNVKEGPLALNKSIEQMNKFYSLEENETKSFQNETKRRFCEFCWKIQLEGDRKLTEQCQLDDIEQFLTEDPIDLKVEKFYTTLLNIDQEISELLQQDQTNIALILVDTEPLEGALRFDLTRTINGELEELTNSCFQSCCL